MKEGDIADGNRRACGDAGEDIRIVLLIGRENVEVNLHLIHESLGEQRPKRPIDQTRCENFLGSGAALALHEPAGELPGRRSPLAVINLKWKEIDPFAWICPNHRAKDDSVAVLHGDRTIRQLGESSSFNRESLSADLALNSNCLHAVSPWPLGCEKISVNGPQMDRSGYWM